MNWNGLMNWDGEAYGRDGGMSDDKAESGEALESLTTHAGWQMFCRHVVDEWGQTGVTYQAELDKALGLSDNDAAASQARQVRSGQKAILRLLQWPASEAVRLRRLEDPARGAGGVVSRGGYT